ncbi:hypothetical protein ACH436_05350 [Isoptericola sp. NPDC019693]|uniref:hypothetical protein n=1 Tax=Isoptericola sp. NPDC019693 TaxID=3364009 RepID=UPI0037909266
MTQDPPTHDGSTAGTSHRDASDQAPRPVPTAPRDPGSGAGIDDLDGLDDLPVAEHVERFTRVHDALRARLDAGQDDAPAAEPRR